MKDLTHVAHIKYAHHGRANRCAAKRAVSVAQWSEGKSQKTFNRLTAEEMVPGLWQVFNKVVSLCDR